MSSVMFENILKELSNLISENDLHVSQVCTATVLLQTCCTQYLHTFTCFSKEGVMFPSSYYCCY